MTPPPASPAANIALVRAGFQDFTNGDLDACVARLTPDFVINLAELPQRSEEHTSELQSPC